MYKKLLIWQSFVITVLPVCLLVFSGCGDSSTNHQPIPTNVARGDINLNDISYEISDAVLLTNYFMYGESVFDIDPIRQMIATDANADGLLLTTADLVYLIRVIVGDALPYPQEITNEATPKSADYLHTSEGTMSISDGSLIGAAYVILEGNVTPTLLADNMELDFNYDGTNTRVIIYSHEGAYFTGEFMATNGAYVVKIELATRAGDPVAFNLPPTGIFLEQYYPNPFSETTYIMFWLPIRSYCTITITDTNGDFVSDFSGYYEAGVNTIDLEKSELIAGLYFCKLTVRDFETTIKLVILR